MSAETRKRAQQIVELVLREPGNRQETRLRELCGDDDQLLQESSTLLKRAQPADQDQSLADTAADHQVTPWSRKSLSADLAGESFAHFQLIEEIARGGMGVVYKARDTKLDRIVALKMILGGRLASEEDVRRFQTEAQAAAGLDHPHIVPVYEADEHEGRQYISMAYVQGDSLQTHRGDKTMAPREAAAMMKRIADAIHYAHNHGVVHRDLKPSNVLVDENGQPRVMDFGLAKRTEVDTSLTATGQVMGTPQYMAPEQAAGKIGQVGPLSDVYALGAMLYCLLTGRPPFQAASLMDTLNQVLEAEPVSPRLLNPAVPKDLETICLRCLAKNPQDRFFRSAGELADDLQRFLDEEPLHVRPLGRVVRIGRWCRKLWQRQRRWVVATAVSLLLATVAIIGAVYVGEKAGRNQQIAEISSRFDDGLKSTTWSAAHFDKLNGLVDDLEALSKEQGEVARRRLHRQFADVIRKEIQRPRPTAARIQRIESWLVILAKHDASTAEQLRQQLDVRRSRRAVVFQLETPFDSAKDVFADFPVKVSDSALRRPETRGTLPVVLTEQPCSSHVLLEAAFDGNWEDATQVGLVLNGAEKQGYHFVLKTLSSPDGGPAPAFKTVRSRKGSFLLEIRNWQRTLRVRSVPAKLFPRGPLRFTAVRDGLRLSCQIGPNVRLEFFDILPLPAQSPGRFGLIWPASVGLQQLSASQRIVPQKPSPMEKGDRLYFQREYAAARAFYRQQAQASAGTPEALEARVKEAFCLLAMKQTDQAGELLGTIAYEPIDNEQETSRMWRDVALGQLLLVRIRQKKYTEADAIIQQLQFSKVQAGQADYGLAAVTHNSIREEILGHLTATSGGMQFLQPDKTRLQKLRLAVELNELLEISEIYQGYTQLLLLRAYDLAGQSEQGIAAARGFVQKMPLSLQPDDRLVMEQYGWLTRTAFPEGAKREQVIRDALRSVDHHLVVNASAADVKQRYRPDLHMLLVERARLNAALKNPEQAAKDLDDYFQIVTEAGNNYRTFSSACLMRGFLYQDAGQTEKAMEFFRRGRRRPDPKKAEEFFGHVHVINLLIAAGLSDDKSDAELEKLLFDFLKRYYGSIPPSSIKGMMSRMGIRPVILRDMWRTPRGRKAARKIVFQSAPFPEAMRLPLVLFASQAVLQTGFAKQPTEEQRTWIWNAFDRRAADVFAGKIRLSMLQLGAAATAWGGSRSSWNLLKFTFPAHVRAQSSCILGFRYEKLGRKEDAAAFFRAAIAGAGDDATLKRLANDGLRALNPSGK